MKTVWRQYFVLYLNFFLFIYSYFYINNTVKVWRGATKHKENTAQKRSVLVTQNGITIMSYEYELCPDFFDGDL